MTLTCIHFNMINMQGETVQARKVNIRLGYSVSSVDKEFCVFPMSTRKNGPWCCSHNMVKTIGTATSSLVCIFYIILNNVKTKCQLLTNIRPSGPTNKIPIRTMKKSNFYVKLHVMDSNEIGNNVYSKYLETGRK